MNFTTINSNKAQLAAWEAMIIMMLIGYGGYMTYLWASKSNETKIFQKGSNPRIIEPTEHFGCANIKIEELRDAVTNKTSH